MSLDFPDLSSLAHTDSTGFLIGYRAPYDPRSTMGTAEKNRYDRSLRRCSSTAQKHNGLDRAQNVRYLRALSDEWGQIIRASYESASAMREGRVAERCSVANGITFHAQDGLYADGYFETVFSEEQEQLDRNDAKAARQLDRLAARVFVRCFATYEQTLSTMRASQRARLFRLNRAEIARYTDAATTAIVKLEKQYHVKL